MKGIREAGLRDLRDAIEDLYACSDGLMASLSDDDWRRKHGKEWVMADVPYHLAYFDRELVVEALKRGDTVAESERESLNSMAKIDAWNGRHFRERPVGMTPAQEMDELQAVRQDVREAVDALTDESLDSLRVWVPLAGLGWRTARMALASCIAHNWSELIQLRLRLKRRDFMPAAASTHLALDAFMHMFPMGMDAGVAARKPLTARFRFEGDAGGAWTLRATGAGCDVRDDGHGGADLTLAMSPETFARMWNQMDNPMLLMLRRRVRVQGFLRMGTFGKVFPTPKGDTPTHPELVSL